MKVAKITLLITSLVVLLLFYLSNRMTVSPVTISGNGNPALIVVAILLPMFFLMVILWVRILKVHSISKRFYIVGIILTFVHLILAFIYQRISLTNYRDVIKDALIEKNGEVDDQYVQSITTVLDIHVNNQYFNINTFFMFISLSIFIALVVFYLLDSQEEKIENKDVQE
ncbi:hypothetical protein ABE61_06790 [Lysinibacillus sphaericus]|uniref:hypothetical protein n=2 Tax=Lysinibacillus sphaericus TaxID=1421 RepID=UPI0018CC8C3C|nr:hypothetical protein [Lysinibacillus sphaericus]MBG9453794.1 hypothetical protein [Lysinibacillus sphaericus]MBG9476264.1 hypothetical protein [Lysinibacillus sphaericus]MBG9591678.1 hypothetical protein [Lysinibacillus sphaericus]